MFSSVSTRMSSAPISLSRSMRSQSWDSLITACIEHHPSCASGRTVGLRMPGRIVIASISKNVPPAKILAVISVLQFASVLILVFAGNTAMAVAALVLLGLGMAGAFPTTTAFTGDLMGNSPLGMSVFTGIGSLGGILTPQVIGVLADRLGFQAAIMFLVLDAFLLALFGVGALRYAVKKVR